MPADTLTPPAAPAAPPSAPPPASIPAGVEPIAPPAAPPAGSAAPASKQSAKERMFGELRKKFGATTPDPAPEKPAGGEGGAPNAPGEGKEADPAHPKDATVTPEAEKKKVNPWRLIDDYKKKVGELETELVSAKRDGLSAKEKEDLSGRIAEMEKRIAEKEDELRFTRFEKSDEFKQKYHQPYEEAWKRAMSELSEISVEDPSTGQSRPATAQDMLDLVNLPLGKAREIANQLFGDFADDAMAHRKDIRNLFEQQQRALEDARKNGAERERKMLEEHERTHKEVTGSITNFWTEANERAKKDEKFGKFFAHAEGDEEFNKRIDRGFALADQAFSENPLAPNLTPEQRRDIVTRHAAIRNRAAAFSGLVLQLERAAAKIESLNKELEGFKKSTPGGGEGGREAKPEQPQKGMAGLLGELRKKAH